MARKSPKTAVVAFKVEEELAEFLNQIPNKSEFIRKAIVAQMSMSCPLCSGTGQVTRWTHDHYQQILASWRARQCDGCGVSLTLPNDPGALGDEDLIRMEQFVKGGPLYCDPCYDKAPTCDDCGMHVGPDQAPKHHHEDHPEETGHTHPA